MKECIKWTTEKIEYLTEITPGKSYKEIRTLMCDRFPSRFEVGQIKSAISRYGLHTGRKEGGFKKGHTPYNKGTKGVSKPNKGCFAKGHRGIRRRPIGSEYIDPKRGIAQVKVGEPNIWKYKHRVIWEEANGPIPDDHCIIFLDGDKTNVTLGNLALVSRLLSGHMTGNGLFDTNPEVTKSGTILAKLMCKTTEAKERTKK